MTNRQRIADAYKATATKRLRDEVTYYLDTYDDTEGFDVADALYAALNHAEANYDKPMAKDCIDVMIAAGFYRPRTGEVVTMGRDRSPVRNGKRYDCETAWCLWINED
jgi:Golgi nucleoside diphosphatase